jgi:uncharacterized membrane protein YbhN (UPF0104 family)
MLLDTATILFGAVGLMVSIRFNRRLVEQLPKVTDWHRLRDWRIFVRCLQVSIAIIAVFHVVVSFMSPIQGVSDLDFWWHPVAVVFLVGVCMGRYPIVALARERELRAQDEAPSVECK